MFTFQTTGWHFLKDVSEKQMINDQIILLFSNDVVTDDFKSSKRRIKNVFLLSELYSLGVSILFWKFYGLSSKK